MPDRGPRKPSAPGVGLVERQSSRSHRDHSDDSAAVDGFVDEDFTDRYDIEELPRLRDKRPTLIRIRHLEKNQDENRADVRALTLAVHRNTTEITQVKVAIADVVGQMKVIPELVDAMKDATSALQQRDHLTFTAKVDVDKARAMDELKDHEAKRTDTLEFNKAKREWVTKVFAIVSSVIAVIATAVAAGRC